MWGFNFRQTFKVYRNRKPGLTENADLVVINSIGVELQAGKGCSVHLHILPAYTFTSLEFV